MHPAPRRATLVICAPVRLGLAVGVVRQGRHRRPWPPAASSSASAPRPSSRSKPASSSGCGSRTATASRPAGADGTRRHRGQADQPSVGEQHQAADADLQRTTSLLSAMHAAACPRPTPQDEGRSEDAAHLQSEWQDINARLAKLDAEHARRWRRGGDRARSHRQARRHVAAGAPARGRLQGPGRTGLHLNQHAGQDRSRERIEQERDLATQHARLAEAQAAMRESRQNKAAYLAEDAAHACASARPWPRSSASNSPGAPQDRPAPAPDATHRAGGRHRAAGGRAHRGGRGHARRRC